MSGRLGTLTMLVLLSAIAVSCGSADVSAPHATTHRTQATPSAQARLASCPATLTASQLPLIVRTGGRPDDISVTGAGHMWVTDAAAGTITEYSPTGTVLAAFPDPAGPEGIVALDNGRVLVAEPSRNRVIELDPHRGTSSVLVALPNLTGNPGLDGLGIDVSGERLLIPDSPNGALRTLPLAGGPLTTLATNLGRPVAATAGPDNSIYVGAESRTGLASVPASGGAPRQIGGFVDVDDVVAGDGLLYLTNLADGTVDAVDPVHGTFRTLATGLAHPEGLARLPGERLVVVDETSGTISALGSCGPAATSR